MERKTDKESHSREALILEAAKREFLQKGYAGARTVAIAEAAGVTHAMLHYYFRTKERLFSRVVGDTVALLRSALFTPVEDMHLPFSEMILSIIERHLDFLASHPDLPRFVISEIYGNPERMSTVMEKIREYSPMFFSALQEKIDHAALRGECRAVDARMLILDIASLNIFSFMAAPVVSAVLPALTDDTEAFIALRKSTNYDTIMRKLKP